MTIVLGNSKRAPSKRLSRRARCRRLCYFSVHFPPNLNIFLSGKINGLFSFRQFGVVRRTSVWNPQRLGALVLRKEGYRCYESAFMVPLAMTSSEIIIFFCPPHIPPFFLLCIPATIERIRQLIMSRASVLFLCVSFIMNMEISRIVNLSSFLFFCCFRSKC